MARTSQRQSLIFDADDTLWENNVLFERVVDDYVEWLAHPSLERAEIRRLIAEIEEANIVAHGYGSQVFLRSLGDCFTRLYERPLGASERGRMAQFEQLFTSGQVELIPNVTEVLAELGTRHELYLMTKGAAEEQQRKIDASGLADRFTAIDIVPVKVADTYRKVVDERGLDPARTWMIGNSPKSDVVAARQAGLNAVFVPHEHTWAHELAELDPTDDKILHVATFAELTVHF